MKVKMLEGRRMKLKLTKKGAIALAVALWGKNGAVSTHNGKVLPFAVGTVFLGIAFEVKGQGATWEDAFRDAEKKGRCKVSHLFEEEKK